LTTPSFLSRGTPHPDGWRRRTIDRGAVISCARARVESVKKKKDGPPAVAGHAKFLRALSRRVKEPYSYVAGSSVHSDEQAQRADNHGLLLERTVRAGGGWVALRQKGEVICESVHGDVAGDVGVTRRR